MAANPQPPENRNPTAIRKNTVAAGTRIGLNTTRTGVERIRATTVPVKVSADIPSNAAPAAVAVIILNTCLERAGGSRCLAGMDFG